MTITSMGGKGMLRGLPGGTWLALLLVLTGCGGSPSGSDESTIRGRYTLQTVDGKALPSNPRPVVGGTPGDTYEIIMGWLELRDGDQYARVIETRRSAHNKVEPGFVQHHGAGGTYERRGSQILLTTGRLQDTVTISGNTIVAEWLGWSQQRFVFVK